MPLYLEELRRPNQRIAEPSSILTHRMFKHPVVLSKPAPSLECSSARSLKFANDSLKPQISAVFISIAKYHNISPASWNGQDGFERVLQLKHYLESHLGLTGSCHDTILIDDSATRKEIIHALKELKKSATLGQPILIYYAGLGEITDVGCPIPTSIVPVDYSRGEVANVPVISHQELDEILSQLAVVAGDNITVVFDYSSSTFHEPTSLDPSAYFPSLTDNFQYHPFSQLTFFAGPTGYPPKSSTVAHVVHDNSFSALLGLLYEEPPHELRWSEIISHIRKFSSQTSQAKGPNPDRALFDGKLLIDHRGFFYAKTLSAERLSLDGGTMQGVTLGAEFAVYPRHLNQEYDKTLDIFIQNPLGIFRVESVQASSAILFLTVENANSNFNSKGIFAGPFYAMQIKAGTGSVSLRIYLPSEGLPCQETLLPRLQNKGIEGDHLISIVEDPNTAHIQVEIKDGKVNFVARDDVASQLHLSSLHSQVDPTVRDIVRVLKAAANYYSKINLTNNILDIGSRVHIELYEARNSLDMGTSDRAGLGPIPVQNGKVELLIEENKECLLGFKLVNESSHDLYPYLYFFDASHLAIDLVYPPHSSKSSYPASPIGKNGGVVSFGHTNEAPSALSFYLRDDQNVNVGFFKLFLLTRPITQMSAVPQPESFDQSVAAAWVTAPLLHVLQYRSGPKEQERVSAPVNSSHAHFSSEPSEPE